ncbi:MAG: hypothetical protein N2Z72_03165 [Bacteroidales bacterium]|nr:hypothetical protein [Bacteroidales bacterium]
MAEFEKEKLYAEDIFIPSGLDKKDSLAYLNKQVDNWIKKEALFRMAKENLPDSVLKIINKKLQDVEKQLVLAAYENWLIDSLPPIHITDEEIADFYHKNKNEFPLQQVMVQLHFVEISQQDPNYFKIKQQFLYPSPDLTIINSLTSQAKRTFLVPNTWVYFKDVVKEIPFSFKDTIAFVQNTTFFEVKTTDAVFLGRIYKYLLPHQNAPLFMVKDMIKDLLYHTKKNTFLEELYNKKYLNALHYYRIKNYMNEK